MKLDSEWISKAAARTVDAEDALTGDGVFTHRAAPPTSAAEPRASDCGVVDGMLVVRRMVSNE